MERQDAAPERTGAEKAGKSEWEKNSQTAWQGSDFVLLRCLSIQRYTTSLRIRHACFLFAGSLFAGMILCGLYVWISHVIEKAKRKLIYQHKRMR